MSAPVTPPRRIYVCLSVMDMRKSFDGLAVVVQEVLAQDPFEEAWFVFRNRAGDRVKVLWWDGSGYCILYKRLEHGTFVFPRVSEGSVQINAAQLGLLFEGMDWRRLSVRSAPKPQRAA